MVELKSVLKFLSILAQNNDRPWFNENKETYLHAKSHFDDFVSLVLQELTVFEKKLIGLDPKKLSFRIYRDIRFSKEKHPYKLHMGAAFSPNVKKVQEPMYYIHIEPGNKSFAAGGIYRPDSTMVKNIRQEIDYNADKIERILKNPTFMLWYESLDSFDKLKTAPKGYPKDHKQIDILKNKNFVSSHYFSDKEVVSKNFLKNVAKSFKAIKPLNDFLTEAMA